MENSILEQEFSFGIDNENTHGEEGLLCIGIDHDRMPDDQFFGSFEELADYVAYKCISIDLNLADYDTEENRKLITFLFKDKLPNVDLEIN